METFNSTKGNDDDDDDDDDDHDDDDDDDDDAGAGAGGVVVARRLFSWRLVPAAIKTTTSEQKLELDNGFLTTYLFP